MSENLILKTEGSKGYELIDSGEGQKLERFGDFVLSRPDPQALWKKNYPEKWSNAQATFVHGEEGGKWESGLENPEWKMTLDNLTFLLKLGAFKHVGVFPEQLPNWQWVKQVIESSGHKISVLNLFGYTGGATLACASAGAEVTHVDGSKSAVSIAKENANLSLLAEKPIRWIVDDVRTFIKREIKRGNKYDAIIMDPPAFGRGAKGEIWKVEDDFLDLLDSCREILSADPLFVLINGYSAGYSPIAYKNALDKMMLDWSGNIESGELAIEETASKRLLPAGIFARWKKA